MTTPSQPTTEKSTTTYQTTPRVMFLEYGDWKKDQHFISAIIKNPGEKRGKVAARIFLQFDGETKRASYITKDAQGNELFPATPNLYQLKKDIKDNAKELAEKLRSTERETPEKIIPERNPEQPKKERKSLKQKAQDFTHSLVPEKMKSENPEQEKAIEQLQREYDLKEARGDKGNEKNKGQKLSR